MASTTLTLLLPGALPRMPDAFPALAHLLRSGRMLPGADAAWALARSYGLERQQDWPLAPLMARGDGLDAVSGYWLCCDPVHLEAGMNGLILHEDAGMSPSREESLALAEVAAEEWTRHWPGARLFAPHPRRWYVRLDGPPDLITEPPERAFHFGVAACLPRGRDANRAMRLISDAQMALHTHAVNQRREAEGLPTWNSIWLWGGGVLKEPGAKPDRMLGGAGIAAHLAALVGTAEEDFPDRMPPLQGQVLAQAPAIWPALEAGWFRPLASRLRWGRLGCLRLAFTDACVELRPRDMWRFSGGPPPDTSGR